MTAIVVLEDSRRPMVEAAVRTRLRAAAIVVFHNHPSGDPEPSQEDRDMTRRLVKAGKILGIRLLDHLVIGDQRYFSFADQGEL